MIKYLISIILIIVAYQGASGKRKLIHSREVNRPNISYVTNPGYAICQIDDNRPIYMLIYVQTSPANYKRRQSLRDTWARRSMFRDTRLVFMTGMSTDLKINKLVALESYIYGDIVQGSFIGTYRNLTYNAIMSMQWIERYCAGTRFVLKSDDDMIINMFVLMRHLHELDENQMFKPRTILCSSTYEVPIHRDPKSKWYMSRDEYPSDFLKYDYCSGSAVVFTGDLPPLLVEVSKRVEFFWIDDYFLTGLAAHVVNVSFVDLSELYIFNYEYKDNTIPGQRTENTIFEHITNRTSKVHVYWSHILKTQISLWPSLFQVSHSKWTTLINPDDFSFIDHFWWTRDLINPIYKKQLSYLHIYSRFNNQIQSVVFDNATKAAVTKPISRH